MSIVIAHQDRRITGYGKTCMDTAARRTRYIWGRGREPQVLHNLRDESEYVDFNLGKYSAHSHYEKYAGRFRVTDYPPEEMKKYHGNGLHIYRIAN